MRAMASQITSLTIVYPTVYSGVDQRKHKNSASLAFVRGIHRWPVHFPHKGPVTQKLFPFDDVIMLVHFRDNHVGCVLYSGNDNRCRKIDRMTFCEMFQYISITIMLRWITSACLDLVNALHWSVYIRFAVWECLQSTSMSQYSEIYMKRFLIHF